MLAAVNVGDTKKLAELMRSAVIPLLLAHPDTDVNAKNIYGETPFVVACGGHVSCVREMPKDSRVKVNEPDNGGWTPTPGGCLPWSP